MVDCCFSFHSTSVDWNKVPTNSIPKKRKPPKYTTSQSLVDISICDFYIHRHFQKKWPCLPCLTHQRELLKKNRLSDIMISCSNGPYSLLRKPTVFTSRGWILELDPWVIYHHVASLQGGPIPVVNGIITPISRVKSPQLPISKAIYRGYNSIYN